LALGCILEAVVGSRDLARSRTFHGQAFGFEVVAAAGGEVLMGAAGVATGRLRLVPAASDPPLPPPSPWELGPRLLGVCSRDLARTRAAVEAAGGWVGPAVRYPYGDFTVERRERPVGLRGLVFASPEPEEALRALLEAGGRPLGRDRVLGPEGIEIGVRAPV
jgi:hypothetical protein